MDQWLSLISKLHLEVKLEGPITAHLAGFCVQKDRYYGRVKVPLKCKDLSFWNFAVIGHFAAKY